MLRKLKIFEFPVAIIVEKFSKKDKPALAVNRTRGESMATTHFTTKPLMLLNFDHASWQYDHHISDVFLFLTRKESTSNWVKRRENEIKILVEIMCSCLQQISEVSAHCSCCEWEYDLPKITRGKYFTNFTIWMEIKFAEGECGIFSNIISVDIKEAKFHSLL